MPVSRSQYPISGILQNVIKYYMLIEFTINDIKKLRCLGNTLASDLVPVKEIKEFLAGLEQKLDSPAGKKRNNLKADRKEMFRRKLRVA
jgi:hypothetical protein